jgi:hypothetical protein
VRRRYLAVLALLALVLVTQVESVTTGPAALPATRSSLGVLRITRSEAIPSDLGGVRYLLLDATRAAKVAGLKARYPRLRVLAYKNLSFLIDYSSDELGNAGMPWPEAQAHEDWFLHDPAGDRVASVRFGNAWFADVGLAAYQRAWLKDVLSFLRQSPWDGVFIDDANADPGWHLGGAYTELAKYPTRDAYRAAERSMLAAVGPAFKAAGYLALPNVAAAPDQADVWADWASLTSGAMLEHFLERGESTDPAVTGGDWTSETDVERAVEGAGRVFLGLTYGSEDDGSAQGYVRASFLLFDDPSTASASIWAPNAGTGAKLDLGAPLGPATRSGTLWTRRFERGTLDVDASAGTFRVSSARR